MGISYEETDVVVSPNTSSVSVGHGVAEMVAVVLDVSNPVMVGAFFVVNISATQRLRSSSAYLLNPKKATVVSIVTITSFL